MLMFRTDVVFVFPSCDDGEFDVGWEHEAAIRRVERDALWGISYAKKQVPGSYAETYSLEGSATSRRSIAWFETCQPGDAWFDRDTIFCMRRESWDQERIAVVDGVIKQIPEPAEDYLKHNLVSYLNDPVED